MPVLGTPKEEMDRTYTPLEAKRRSAMNLRPMRYGFFRVAKESVAPPVCARCHRNIYGQALKINGVITHYKECV